MKTYLEERIEWYDDNYRNGNALISDKQFDQLEKNLLRTNPNCDYFKKKNKLVLPSLEKDSINEFLKGLLVDTKLLIEPKIEAKGFGISITTKVKKGESPLESADRLVLKEQRIRKSRYYSWVRSINEKQ